MYSRECNVVLFYCVIVLSHALRNVSFQYSLKRMDLTAIRDQMIRYILILSKTTCGPLEPLVCAYVPTTTVVVYYCSLPNDTYTHVRGTYDSFSVVALQTEFPGAAL